MHAAQFYITGLIATRGIQPLLPPVLRQGLSAEDNSNTSLLNFLLLCQFKHDGWRSIDVDQSPV